MSRRYTDLKRPGQGIPRVPEAEEKPRGICDFAIVDPDGTLLCAGYMLE